MSNESTPEQQQAFDDSRRRNDDGMQTGQRSGGPDISLQRADGDVEPSQRTRAPGLRLPSEVRSPRERLPDDVRSEAHAPELRTEQLHGPLDAGRKEAATTVDNHGDENADGLEDLLEKLSNPKSGGSQRKIPSANINHASGALAALGTRPVREPEPQTSEDLDDHDTVSEQQPLGPTVSKRLSEAMKDLKLPEVIPQLSQDITASLIASIASNTAVYQMWGGQALTLEQAIAAKNRAKIDRKAWNAMKADKTVVSKIAQHLEDPDISMPADHPPLKSAIKTSDLVKPLRDKYKELDGNSRILMPDIKLKNAKFTIWKYDPETSEEVKHVVSVQYEDINMKDGVPLLAERLPRHPTFIRRYDWNHHTFHILRREIATLRMYEDEHPDAPKLSNGMTRLYKDLREHVNTHHFGGSDPEKVAERMIATYNISQVAPSDPDIGYQKYCTVMEKYTDTVNLEGFYIDTDITKMLLMHEATLTGQKLREKEGVDVGFKGNFLRLNPSANAGLIFEEETTHSESQVAEKILATRLLQMHRDEDTQMPIPREWDFIRLSGLSVKAEDYKNGKPERVIFGSQTFAYIPYLVLQRMHDKKAGRNTPLEDVLTADDLSSYHMSIKGWSPFGGGMDAIVTQLKRVAKILPHGKCIPLVYSDNLYLMIKLGNRVVYVSLDASKMEGSHKETMATYECCRLAAKWGGVSYNDSLRPHQVHSHERLAQFKTNLLPAEYVMYLGFVLPYIALNTVAVFNESQIAIEYLASGVGPTFMFNDARMTYAASTLITHNWTQGDLDVLDHKSDSELPTCLQSLRKFGIVLKKESVIGASGPDFLDRLESDVTIPLDLLGFDCTRVIVDGVNRYVGTLQRKRLLSMLCFQKGFSRPKSPGSELLSQIPTMNLLLVLATYKAAFLTGGFMSPDMAAHIHAVTVELINTLKALLPNDTLSALVTDAVSAVIGDAYGDVGDVLEAQVVGLLRSLEPLSYADALQISLAVDVQKVSESMRDVTSARERLYHVQTQPTEEKKAEQFVRQRDEPSTRNLKEFNAGVPQGAKQKALPAAYAVKVLQWFHDTVSGFIKTYDKNPELVRVRAAMIWSPIKSKKTLVPVLKDLEQKEFFEHEGRKLLQLAKIPLTLYERRRQVASFLAHLILLNRAIDAQDKEVLRKHPSSFRKLLFALVSAEEGSHNFPADKFRQAVAYSMNKGMMPHELQQEFEARPE